ncbi:threonine/serine dehydratase [Candidatus Bipolaricaulota bacterium]|nr:threonine/serine dehydratase [Candidatus Bipolaricaulota bacterium]
MNLTNKELLEMDKLAYERINEYVRRTDLTYSEYLSSLCNGSVHLKLENTQLTKAFKIRGVYNGLLCLQENGEVNGVTTASSGNHGLALALVGKQLELPVKIFVPNYTPEKKTQKIRKSGADLTLYGDNFDEAERKAHKVAEEEGMTYLSSYNDKRIVAGQSTVGFEIVEDLPEVEDVVVPVGGGSLVSGIASVVKANNPDVRIIGAQSQASPVMYESVKAGQIVEMEIQDSIADGLAGGIEEGAITFELVQKLVDEIIPVKEKTIREAIKSLCKEDGQRSEGAGAVGVAALIEHPNKFKGKTTVVVISGGNIDDKLFESICA